MDRKQLPKERLPERKDPGDPEGEWCSPGSIEQQLDMCEQGSLRGDDILHSHGREPHPYTGDPIALDQLEEHERFDLSEEDREGDEMSGDEHSSGLSGGESELMGQSHIATALPGDMTRHQEQDVKIEELAEQGLELPVGSEEGALSVRRIKPVEEGKLDCPPSGPKASSNLRKRARTMKRNVGSRERVARIAVGVVSAAGAILLPGGFLLRTVLGVVGLGGLGTGFSRYCPVNQALGIDRYHYRKEAKLPHEISKAA